MSGEFEKAEAKAEDKDTRPGLGLRMAIWAKWAKPRQVGLISAEQTISNSTCGRTLFQAREAKTTRWQ
jgi:hypothetical protein